MSGDGVLEGPEECDDGGFADGDCCSSSCELDPLDTPCPDASVCTSDETCDGNGVCVIGSVLTCDDGILCSYDFCDPIEGCLSELRPTPPNACNASPRRSKLLIRDRAGDSRDELRVKLKSHTYLSSADDLGDPTATTDYAVCVFDSSADGPALLHQIDVPAGPPWLRRGNGVFSYVDKSGSTGGIQGIRLKQLSQDTDLRIKARGPNLSLAGPVDSVSYFDQDPSVTVQLQNSVGGCWSAQYRERDTLRNTPSRFKARVK